MEIKFDVIVHQMILHQPCSLQEYVSSIAAQHPLSTTCKQQPHHPHLSRKSEPCKAVGEHGTGDHLIAHTASPIFQSGSAAQHRSPKRSLPKGRCNHDRVFHALRGMGLAPFLTFAPHWEVKESAFAGCVLLTRLPSPVGCSQQHETCVRMPVENSRDAVEF